MIFIHSSDNHQSFLDTFILHSRKKHLEQKLNSLSKLPYREKESLRKSGKWKARETERKA